MYRAEAADGQIVAIKLLAPQAELDGESVRARFEREIRALAEVRHPNLIELLDHGVDEELGPYLVTPLYTGKTLRELVAGAALCPEAMLLIVAPVLDALAALHEAGLVHRDVKPENILATPNGRIVLVDLGLAFEAGQTRYTDDGAVVGSVPYMAPEQIEGGDITAAADVWASAVMAYELCAGRRPFERARPSEEAAAVLVGAFASLHSAVRRAGPEHGALIAACLQLDVAARPTAASLARSARGLMDWFEPGHEASEAAAVIADPVAYAERIAGVRTRRLARAAEKSIDAGEPFAALKLIDRGLAYRPDDAQLRELCACAEQASGDAASSPVGSSRRRMGFVAGAVGVAVIAGMLAVVMWPRGGDKSPAAASSASQTTGQTFLGQPVAKGSNADKALDVFGGMLDLMNQGVTAKERAAGITARPHDPKKADDAALRVMGGMFSLLKRSQAAEDVAATQSSGVVTVAPIPLDSLSNRDPAVPVELAAAPGTQLIARSYLGGQDPKRIMADADAEVTRDPSDGGRHATRVLVYLAAGHRAAGLAQLDRALARNPKSVTLWAVKGYVELRRGNNAAADVALTRAIAIDPRATNALRNRGILRRRLGRTRDAYEDLTRALSLKPRDVEAMAELVLVYRAAGRAEDARPLLQRACKLGKTAACSPPK